MSRFRLSALLVVSAGVIAVLLVRRGNSYMAAPASERVAAKDPEPEVAAEPVVAAEPEVAAEPQVAAEPVAVEPEPEPVVIVEPEPEPAPIIAIEPEPISEPEPELIMALEPEPEPQPEPESDPGYWAVPSAPPADWSDERRSA